ncbi:winged helix DNA-binding domain-containing protein [Planomonospora alba]|uniref:Winged helix DNA-binding domain-containing protein n=1 Tax=Planomonospora alba TaxID=161354 RepID=A0ABP6NQQ2_9ACTN
MTPSDVPTMTWAEVRALRLRRHGLAEPFTGAGPADVAAATAGTHAQVMSAAELAIGSRLAGATRSDVRAALWEERSLVKTFGPRGTVHLLPARDLEKWVGALSPLTTGPGGFPPEVRLTPEQTEQVVAAIADALADAVLTIDELGDEVVGRTGPWAADLVMPAFQGRWPRWRQALHLAGMRGVLCFGPNRGRKVTYTDPRRWLPGFRPAQEGPALAWAVRGYLHAYGPSTPQRFANWLGAPVSRASEAFAALAGELRRVDVEGTPAWTADGTGTAAGEAAARSEAVPGVRLLPYFDGYSYRVGVPSPERLYPGAAAGRALAGNFQNLLVDGVVAGLWHQRRSGRRIDVTVEPFAPLSAAHRAALDEQVERVGLIMEGTPRLTIGRVTAGGHA